MTTITEVGSELQRYTLTPTNGEVEARDSGTDAQAGRPRRIRRAVALTFSHIYSAVLPYVKPEKAEPVPNTATIYAAEYVTAIRALRAIQIFHTKYRTTAQREAGKPNFVGILNYSTRPDSPLNDHMEEEVLALDFSRMK